MTADYRELLIGCGSSRERQFTVGGRTEWTNLTTLDFNADHKPDVVHDLEQIPLPFEDESFDELHAYETLEHQGRQGDWRFFFAQFSDFWRILKPGGLILGTCPLPSSPWAWADPSHTRVIAPDTFVFLCQPQYEQVGKTAMSDFRHCYRADFDVVELFQPNEHSHGFVLRAVKPSRFVAP